MSRLSLLVGLGNPGQRYARTRHNAGFWFIDELCDRFGVGMSWNEKFAGWVGQFSWRGESIRLFKPGKFMNLSGGPVSSVCRYYRVAPKEMLVAHDELDFGPGMVRLKVGGGHGGHNGLRSIIEYLGAREFLRLRIGIGRPLHGSVTDYVLGMPGGEELDAIRDAIVKAADALPVLLDDGVEKTMTCLHTRS